MSIESIESAFVTKIKEIPSIKKVYDYEPKKLDTLPSLTMFYDGFDQKRGTYGRSELTHRWVVRVYLSLIDDKKAQKDLKEILQSVIAKSNEDISFGGACVKSIMTTGDNVVIEVPNGGAFLVSQNTFEATEIIF
jgi:hypothetical protein